MTYEELTQIVARYSDLCKCPELKENPFRKRICKVFSVDDSGNLTFDQFVYLFSVFSEKAPREMKVQFAFKIYGNFFNFHTFSILFKIIGFRFWWWWFYWSHRHRKRRQIIDSKWIESRRNRICLGKSLGWRWHRWRQTPFRQWVLSRHYKKSRFHGDISLRYLTNKATPKSTDFLLKILLCVSVNLSVFQRVLRCKSKFFWQIFWLLE